MTPATTITWAAANPPQGTCYRVLMWESTSLPAEQLKEWETERRELLGKMRDAGIKGSRGLLGQLEKELREITVKYIESPLAQAPRAVFSFARVEALATALRANGAVLAYRLGTAAAEILAEVTGDITLPELISSWQTATSDMDWCSAPVIQAMTAAEGSRWQNESRCNESEHDIAEVGSATEFRHVTVLLNEAVEALQPAEGKVMVDATLGGGGHTERLLQGGAEVWGIDQDPAARAAARARLADYGERLHIIAGNFRNAAELLRKRGIGQIDGLLADIGISSPQVDCAERGFSFLHEGPLDMRMNPAAPRSAADIINSAAESEIADILWQYGEERAGRAIARRIVQERAKAPITTTTQLADIIAGVLPRKGKQHPATRSFQALRIAVNDELGALEELLRSGLSLLKSGGRFAVITFHSLEDRAVKRYFEQVCKPEIDRPEWPAPRPNPDYAARLVYRKPLSPSEAELTANPRSRSAKLRVIEKL
ncbi:MAG: 16S rRNA (cytosine(1402)-N(4))-methyltransferase RsmH [Akkermansia sp.]|nr:16S rRNA (cytosine(1402)-N(4))-methyltransferase RsmH [Akkermansia sp.]